MDFASRRSWSARACSGLVLLALVAGCGGGGEDPDGLDAAATGATAANSPKPSSADNAETRDTETPTSGDATAGSAPTERSFPDAGLTVMEPASKSESVRQALDAYTQFAREWRLSLREVRFREALRDLAVPPVLDVIEDSLSYQEEHGIRYSGRMHITLKVEESGERVVVLGGCIDASELTIIDDGEERPIDGIDEHPQMPMRVTVANDGSGWRVNENTLHEDRSC